MSKKISEKLLKARAYEKEGIERISRNLRPLFHFSAPTGWMNDPNGFSMYQGEYHLFYQYNPYSVHWDSMHWGHAKSQDFIKWEYLPAALAPDQEYDNFGIFSGGAVEADGKQYLMYTGVEEKILPNGSRQILQNQCLAVGLGINYEKASQNPVITADMLPEGSSREDFRDPKIWKEDGRYYAAVASRHQDGSGQIALFSSEDLYHWNFDAMLDRSENRCGAMWECPDFFCLGDKRILLISPQDMQAKDLEIHNGNNNLFLIGNYDKKTKKFERLGIQSCDYGLDFYAAQTMETDDGRRVMIGWMQSWDNHMCPPGFDWSGMMTLPRELFLADGLVCQRPVRELEQYRENEVRYDSVTVEEEMELQGVEGRVMDFTLELWDSGYETFELRLAAAQNRYSSILYNRKENTVKFDRTYSGYCRDVISSRSMKVRDRGGELKLRILLDRYSCEIFANDGEQAMTSLIFSPLDQKGIRFLAEGTALVSICKYEIKIQ